MQGKSHLSRSRRAAWALGLASFVVLVLVGLGFERGIEWLGDNWPLILVIIGAVVLLGALTRPRRSARS